MCLWSQGNDDDDSGVVRVRWTCGIDGSNEGGGRGRGIDDATKGLKTTIERARDQRLARRIYNDNGGVGGVR